VVDVVVVVMIVVRAVREMGKGLFTPGVVQAPADTLLGIFKRGVEIRRGM